MSYKFPQVDKEWYRHEYMSLPRAITHWHQAELVAQVTPKGSRVLEIGPGSGFTTWTLRNWNVDVTTLDFDRSLMPDMVGEVTHIPCKTNSFDCLLAAEVLEHLEYQDFGIALSELRRVSNRYVIISLPAPFIGISALINLPGIEPFGLHIGLPYWVSHKFDGQHYWELGKRGYSVNTIRKSILQAGFQIIREFRPAPSLFSYFFVLRKK